MSRYRPTCMYSYSTVWGAPIKSYNFINTLSAICRVLCSPLIKRHDKYALELRNHGNHQNRCNSSQIFGG